VTVMDFFSGSRRSTFALLISGVVVAICASLPGARAQAGGDPIKIEDIFSTIGCWELP